MIDRVEYERVERSNEEGVIFTFIYDTNISDVYEVYGDDAQQAMGMLALAPPPEGLLLELRSIMRLTVH